MINRTKPEEEEILNNQKPDISNHIIYLTILAAIIFTSIIIYFTNPVTIEHNNTIETIREIEVIKEIEKSCPECLVCDASMKCNESECPYSRDYVLSLIRIAKKCEKRDTFSIDECDWRLNRSEARYQNCSTDLELYKDSCLHYCEDMEYDFKNCDDNLTRCNDGYNVCKDNLDSCFGCLDVRYPEDCYAEKRIG